MARVDLELATEHYRGSNLAEKVRAGFSLYARSQDAPGLRRVLDQKELTAEILSLPMSGLIKSSGSNNSAIRKRKLASFT